MSVNKKKAFFSKRTPPKKATYEAKPIDLVLGTDFKLIDDIEAKWVMIELLKGDYAGVQFKFNEIGIVKEPTSEKSLHMKMDYTVTNNNGLSKAELDDDPQFNNIVFNVMYALLQLMDSEGQADDAGRNDIGELDSE